MTTKQLLSSNSYIQYPKFLGFYIGVNEAIILSAFCDKDSLCEYTYENYDGWFYSLREDIYIETGLSEKQQRLAISHLVALDIIQTEKRDVPSKNYYYINVNVLEKILVDALSIYKDYKSQKLQKVTSRSDETQSLQKVTSRSDEKCVSSINTKNKNIRIKKSAPPTSSKNHSQVYKKRESLNDDLESGKDIDEQKKSKKKSPKDKFRDECYDIIDNVYSEKNYSYAVHDLLVEYFEFVSAVPEDKDNLCKRVKTTKAWKHKLDKLDDLVKDGYDPIAIIQQSLDNKAYVFYPLQSVQQSKTNHREGNQENIVVSDPEWAREQIQKAIDNGEEFF